MDHFLLTRLQMNQQEVTLPPVASEIQKGFDFHYPSQEAFKGAVQNSEIQKGPDFHYPSREAFKGTLQNSEMQKGPDFHYASQEHSRKHLSEGIHKGFLRAQTTEARTYPPKSRTLFGSYLKGCEHRFKSVPLG